MFCKVVFLKDDLVSGVRYNKGDTAEYLYGQHLSELLRSGTCATIPRCTYGGCTYCLSKDECRYKEYRNTPKSNEGSVSTTQQLNNALDNLSKI